MSAKPREIIPSTNTFLSIAYVAMGSNIGDTENNLIQARNLITQIEGVQKIESAGLYRTNPISSIPQPDYLNTVIKCFVSCGYRELFKQLVDIEKRLGKVDKLRDAPRVIDLDLLLFGKEIIDEIDLTVPHPRIMNRAFVLVPLLDLNLDGILAFPTREGISMVQLQHQLQIVQMDPQQKVQKIYSAGWGI